VDRLGELTNLIRISHLMEVKAVGLMDVVVEEGEGNQVDREGEDLVLRLRLLLVILTTGYFLLYLFGELDFDS